MNIEDYGWWIGYHDSGHEPVHWQTLDKNLPKAGRYVIAYNGDSCIEAQAGFEDYKIFIALPHSFANFHSGFKFKNLNNIRPELFKRFVSEIRISSKNYNIPWAQELIKILENN